MRNVICWLLFFCFSSFSSLAWSLEKNTVIPAVNVKAAQKTNASKIKRASLQTTEIERETITKSPVLNLSELLQQTQSIVRLSNNSADSSQTALSIRGFGDNAAANSLILIDGFPLMNPSLLAPNFNFMALSDIERVDIIQGSQGSLWGDQAVGGVLNIVTRHPKQFMGDLNLGAGSFDKSFGSALVGSKFPNGFFFKGFGLTHRTDNYRDHNTQKDQSASFQAGYDYPQGTTALTLQAYETTVNFPGGLTEAQFESDPTLASNFLNFIHYKTTEYQLLNKQALNDAWIIETRLSTRQTDGDGFVFLHLKRKDWINTINPKLIGYINRNKIILGYEFQNSHYHLINEKIDTKASARQENIYGQMIIPIAYALDLTLGSRLSLQHNYPQDLPGEVTPFTNRALVTEQGLTFTPTEALSFFLRRDGNFRFPKANEMTWTRAKNEILQPQLGTSYETGVTYKTEKQKTQLNLYRLDLHNEIAFDPSQTANHPIGSFRNFDNTRRYGLTVTEMYQLTPKLSLNGQINFVDARFIGGPYSDNAIPAVPKWMGNAGFNYTWTESWQTQLTALYTGSRYASDDDKNIGKRVSAYWLGTATLQYKFDALRASFEVVNLFNQNYANFVWYNAMKGTNVYYPGAGRSFLLTIKANV